jgi:chemosensory pili system protein ChpA (sensor histidine kinase/response regulator)
MAKDLGGYRIVKLLDVINLITSRLPDVFPEQNETLVMEMAAAFLLIEGVLDNFTNPPGDLEQQVTVMVGWLLDAVKPRSTGPAVAPALRDDVTQRHQLQQIRAQVAREMIANLQQVEQVLDAIARDPSAKDGIASVLESLQQIRGALSMLGLDRATEVLGACEEMVAPIARMASGEIVPRIEWVAEGLSALGFYLEPIQRGQLPGDTLLDHFLARLRRVATAPTQGTAAATAAEPAILPGSTEREGGDPVPQAPTMERPAAPPQPAAAPTTPATAQDVRDAAELLVVYIEESREVLGSTVQHLERVLRDFRDTEALIEIRRGFHTLKGSGRMVGLADLGEFAWEIEQVLNLWLREDRPATPDLLDLIDRARSAFSGWITELEQRQPLDFSHRDGIVSMATRLRLPREGTPETLAAPTPSAPATADPVPVRLAARTGPGATAPVDEIVIGAARLTPALLEIFRSEASTHLGTLEREFVAWQAQPGTLASHEFMRAAHTLASSSRTTGFGAIAELAGTLERWLQHLMDTPADPSSDAIAVVHDSIATLSGMFAEVEARRQPLASRNLVGRIRRLLDAAEGTTTAQPPSPTLGGEAATIASLALPPPPIAAAPHRPRWIPPHRPRWIPHHQPRWIQLHRPRRIPCHRPRWLHPLWPSRTRALFPRPLSAHQSQRTSPPLARRLRLRPKRRLPGRRHTWTRRCRRRHRRPSGTISTRSYCRSSSRRRWGSCNSSHRTSASFVCIRSTIRQRVL